MAHTIHYEGESTVALDAVLAYVAPNGGAGVGGWFVELDTDNGHGDEPGRVEGYVSDFLLHGQQTELGPCVVIAETVPGDPETRTGRTITVPTAHIATLTIP